MKVLFVYSSLVLEKNGDNYYHNFLGTIIKRYSIFGKLTVCTSCVEVNKNKQERVDMSNVRHVAIVKENTVKRLLDKSYNNHIIKEEIQKCDFLIVHQPDSVASRAAHYAKKLKIPYLSVVVGCPWDSYWNFNWCGKLVAPFAYFNTKRTIRQSNYVIYVTEKFLQSRYPSKAPQIACSDVVTTEIDSTICEVRRQNLNNKTKASVLNILTLGGLDVPFKGQIYIIKAISNLNKRGFNYHYYVAGKGNGTALKQQADKLGIRDNFHILGIVSHDKIYETMSEMDIYAQPSKLEGLPRSLVEAMSCGMPAIGANVGGIPELLQDDVLFDKGNIRQIEKILSCDPSRWTEKVEINYIRSKDYNYNNLEKRRNEFFCRIMKELKINQ